MLTLMYNVFIYPIELIVEFFFVFFNESFENIGLSVMGISVAITLLSLPLYHTAEVLQRKEREAKATLESGVKRIKEAFKGDEQYMILSTFYRQNNYHPLYSLKNSLGLLIQVPFFIAAYHFLSNLSQLEGVHFLGIPDLGRPDGIISFGPITLNALPILMTCVSIISAAVYTKGFALRDKIQLYGMSLLFLILLYWSPAGLVFYWTINNILSLIKNLFYRARHPLKILYFIAAIGSLILATIILILHPWAPIVKRLFVVGVALTICLIPLILKGFNVLYERFSSKIFTLKNRRAMLAFSAQSLLWIVQGFLVPLLLIQSSPLEFSFLGVIENPLTFVIDTATKLAGLYLFWFTLIYFLSGEKMRTLIALVLPPLSLGALVNLVAFPGNYGFISTHLVIENPGLINPSAMEVLASTALFLAVLILCIYLVISRREKIIQLLLTILILGTLVTSVVAFIQIHREYRLLLSNIQYQSELDTIRGERKEYVLSRTGKNIFYIFIDRAISSYARLFFEESPYMKSVFEGFNYYPNTVSFGNNTANGGPAMLAGYEYTPDNLNARKSEKMVDKHNEALLVLPRMFSEAGYTVTFTDPPYSNYRFVGDYRPFDPYPLINVKRLEGKYTMQYKAEHSNVLHWRPEDASNLLKARLPIFSLFRTVLPIIREAIYDEGRYLQMSYSSQLTDDFLDQYSQLYYLGDMTDYEYEGDTFTILSNKTPHEPVLLAYPGYKPQDIVEIIHNPFPDSMSVNVFDIKSYHANAATLIQIGEWLERLKREGVYDNTRIIIVADHGYPVATDVFNEFKEHSKISAVFNPLLLVKDFYSRGTLQSDDSFMTNADAVFFSLYGLNIPLINPFTGEEMDKWISKEEVRVFTGGGANFTGNEIEINFSESFSVRDDLRVESNWSPLE